MQPFSRFRATPGPPGPGGDAQRLAHDAARRLRLGYTAALLTVAALTVCSLTLLATITHAHASDATAVNLAGRQRMLSQRIVKEALRLAVDPETDAQQRLAAVRSDLERLASVHAGLHRGDTALGLRVPGTRIAGHAFERLDGSFDRFHAAGKRFTSELGSARAGGALAELLAEEARFLGRMDAVVDRYEAWSRGRALRMGGMHLVLGFAVLAVLGLEVLLVFRPLERQIRRQMLDLAIAQERTQLLAMAAEHTRHAVLLGEADGTIGWVNPAAAEAFRRCEAEVPKLADAAPWLVADEVRAAVAAGEDLHLDEVSGGGDSFAVDLVAVRDAAGRAGRYVLVVTDLSERARRERSRQDVQRRAGRADVTAAVLHNVGNTLNSLALAASAADTALQRSRLPGLTRALEMLDPDPVLAERFFATDPRAGKLPEYLRELDRHLHAEQEQLRSDLGAVLAGVEHIRHVVAEENAVTGSTAEAREAALEDIDASTLLAEAVRVFGGTATAAELELLLPADAPLLLLRVDRHAALQVLGNLLTNAVRATAEAHPEPGPRPPILLTVSSSGPGSAAIEVTDAGVGIETGKIPRLFAPGYSTKPGSEGIGLHASANAATAMGGRLTGASDGPGTGATFRLELPLASAVRPAKTSRREAA